MKTARGTSSERAIRVRVTGRGEPLQFEVDVEDGSGETHYQVTMSDCNFEQLSAGKLSPEECVRSAFLFLLDREPRESILRRFDISVIGRHFPDFGREFPRYRDTTHPPSGETS